MSIFHAIVLGITQGLSEFLPISSSGHLLLVPWLFGWNDFHGDRSFEKAFDVALHLGTLIAVVGYFWSDLVVYVRDGVKAVVDREHRPTPAGRLAWLLLASSIPAAIIGALFSSAIDEHLGQVPLIAVSLIVFGLVLYWADNLPAKRGIDEYSLRDTLLMGGGQALALNPGISRSGVTITVGRMLTFDRDAAARLSFLMAVPVTLGAVIFKMGGLAKDGIPPGFLAPMVSGHHRRGAVGLVGGVGPAQARPHPQLHPLRHLPRRARAGHPGHLRHGSALRANSTRPELRAWATSPRAATGTPITTSRVPTWATVAERATTRPLAPVTSAAAATTSTTSPMRNGRAASSTGTATPRVPGGSTAATGLWPLRPTRTR